MPLCFISPYFEKDYKWWAAACFWLGLLFNHEDGDDNLLKCGVLSDDNLLKCGVLSNLYRVTTFPKQSVLKPVKIITSNWIKAFFLSTLTQLILPDSLRVNLPDFEPPNKSSPTWSTGVLRSFKSCTTELGNTPETHFILPESLNPRTNHSTSDGV
jgi:hypothetical protein